MSDSGGPCGACKFLRRKCVRGCIFAPYFDSEQGAVHFAAVHRVFGASNASKLLLRIPPHRRLDTVVTLCYEAVARVRDPVYGCVAHIFTLQQQVVNLQAELACIQARISTLQRAPFPSCDSLPPAAAAQTSIFETSQSSPEMASFCNSVDQELEDATDHLHSHLQPRDYDSTFFPQLRFRPPTP